METGVEHGRSLPPWPRSSEGGDWRLVVRSATFGVRGAAPRGVVLKRDAEQDHGAAGELQRPERIAERQRAGGGADQRLEVEERPRELGRDARLPVGEQRERQQRARRSPARASATPARRAAGAGGRPSSAAFGTAASPPATICTAVTAIGSRPAQQRRLDDHERRRQRTDSSTSASPPSEAPPPPPPATIPTPASASAKPSQAAGPVELAPGDGGDQRDERRHGADDQRRVADAGALDARVLEHDHEAVADRAGEQDPRRDRGAQVAGARRTRAAARPARSARPSASHPASQSRASLDSGTVSPHRRPAATSATRAE